MSSAEQISGVSLTSRPTDVAQTTPGTFTAFRSQVDAGTQFEAHLHQDDQLAWMQSGSMGLTVDGERWHLRREHLVWIPAGMLHEMSFVGDGELISIYSDRALRPAGEHWDWPRAVQADALACALLLHLTDESREPGRRIRCHALLTDLLGQAVVQHDVVALPRDARARQIAAALLANPADPRGLAEWAAQLGVSAKTLARAFVADTGSSFRQWRIQARLHSAAGMLTAGQSVQAVAAEVGYESPSSFIVAFKQRFGATPARYAQRATGDQGESRGFQGPALQSREH